MTRFLISLFLTASLTYFFQGILFLPWWSSGVAALLSAFIMGGKPGWEFLAGFLGVFTAWAGWALVNDIGVDSILSRQVAQLFPGHLSPTLLGFLSGFIGGLPAGFAALSGALLRKQISPKVSTEKETY